MKIVKTIGLLCLAISSLHAQNFKKMPGGGTDVAMSPDGKVYVVGTSKRVFKFNTSRNNWDVYWEAGRKAKSISASNNAIVVLDSDGKAHRRGYQAKSFNSSGYQDAVLDKDSRLWMSNSAGQVRRHYKDNKWIGSVAKSDKDIVKLCPISSGALYALKNDNTIWLYTSSGGKKLPGGATDIAYDHTTKKLYVVGTSKRVFVWNPRRSNWDLVQNTRNDVRSLAVNKGVIWCTTTRNEIYSNSASSSTDTYKLKITLLDIGAKNTWDGDHKDDYLLDFTPSLSINGKTYAMEHKKFGRNETYVKSYGKPSSLHVRRTKNQSHHAQVQLHVKKMNRLNISNSGIFEIPKSEVINDSGTDFNLKVVVDEVSNDTERIVQVNEKLNLPLILEYLLKQRTASSFSKSSDYMLADFSGFTQSIRKHRMGSGYRNLYLTSENGKRIILDNVSEAKFKNSAYTYPVITYTIELVD